MPLKDILVVIDPSGPSTTRLDVAARLAAQHDAHLTGLFVTAPPQIPGYVAGQLGVDVMQVQERMARELAERAEAAFRAQVERAGIGSRAEWRTARGLPTKVAAVHGRYADLVVVGQIDPENRPDFPVVEPEDLLFDVGRPLLVVPYAGGVQSVGRHVLVAWNASREAARAVNDALPLLEKASKVTILAVNPAPGPDGLGDAPGADIALHLARHGVKAEADHLIVPDLDPADVLLNRLADLSADLLVMGGYGHSRLRERILGGATRHIMRHMTVPVLVSH